MDRLRMLLRLGHKDKVISVELDQHLLLGPCDLGINTNIQEPRMILDPERPVPRLQGLFLVILGAVTRWRPGRRDRPRDRRIHAVEERAINTTPLDTGACKPSIS